MASKSDSYSHGKHLYNCCLFVPFSFASPCEYPDISFARGEPKGQNCRGLVCPHFPGSIFTKAERQIRQLFPSLSFHCPDILMMSCERDASSAVANDTRRQSASEDAIPQLLPSLHLVFMWLSKYLWPLTHFCGKEKGFHCKDRSCEELFCFRVRVVLGAEFILVFRAA